MSVSQYLFAGLAFWGAILLLFILPKMVRAPSVLDRIVVFDLFQTLTSLIMLLLAAVYDSRVLLDVTLVQIIVAFVVTLYFARYAGG